MNFNIHLVIHITALTVLDPDILFDYSNLFNIYSNNTLIKNTNEVINDVTNIVPQALIVALKLRLNVPFNPFLDLSILKYHYTTLASIQNSLNAYMKNTPQIPPNTQNANIQHNTGSYFLSKLLSSSYSILAKSY